MHNNPMLVFDFISFLECVYIYIHKMYKMRTITIPFYAVNEMTVFNFLIKKERQIYVIMNTWCFMIIWISDTVGIMYILHCFRPQIRWYVIMMVLYCFISHVYPFFSFETSPCFRPLFTHHDHPESGRPFVPSWHSASPARGSIRPAEVIRMIRSAQPKSQLLMGILWG